MRKGKASASGGRKSSAKSARSQSQPSTTGKKSVTFRKSDKKSVTPRKSDKDAAGGRRAFGDIVKRKASAEPPSKTRTRVKEVPSETAPEKIRLNRYIANSGVCSRREADNLISMGLITVNGKVISELGYKVSRGDEVRYENKLLNAEKPVYILLNKPKGYLTTTRDPQERNTVMHLLGNSIKQRVYPVGRLDRNTTGLLVLTNDGDLAEKLSHPSYRTRKIYKVELDRPISRDDFDRLAKGVQLDEGRAVPDDVALVSTDGKIVGIELHIGWNRVVRRIFEALNYDVVKLDRTVYAGLDKKDLPRGKWRFLTPEEIVRLKHYR